MKILLTNDDGINAIGIKKLYEALKKYGDVIVVAPNKEMSCSSHSAELRKPIKVEKIDENHYTLDTTPVDCVRLGNNLLGPFDYIFSGINNGLNVGTDVIYSGTLHAALEGTILGIKSAAISTDRNAFEIVDNELSNVLDYIFKNNLFDNSATLNINFPSNKFKTSKGIKLTHQGIKDFKTQFIKTDLGYIENGSFITYDSNIDSDVYNSLYGYITITPIGKNLTNYDYLNKIKNKLQ